MKKLSAWLVFGLSIALLPAPSASAQDTPATEAPQIIGKVADGTPPPPRPPKELDKLKVLDSHVHSRGGRSIIVQRVEAPELPEPPARVDTPQIDLNDPATLAWIEQQRGQGKEHRFAIVSASVIDHTATLLHWWVYDNEGPPEQFSGHSNVDFNHLSGFGSYEVGNVRYSLLMAIGNTDTEAARELCQRHGVSYTEPEVPEIPAGDAAYQITEGDTTNEEGIALMDGLHELYRNEKDRLIAAYEGREQARKDREAYLKAHPPQPKDTVIRYSFRMEPLPETQESDQEGESR
jgi:hypothetical protein